MSKLLNFMLIVSLVLMSSCTSNAWQHSAQEAAKQQCNPLPDGERERCLQRLMQQTQPH